ncbi:hypothetical protein LEMLEM_LOCUS3022, partial [Lemmus lemmus]
MFLSLSSRNSQKLSDFTAGIRTEPETEAPFPSAAQALPTLWTNSFLCQQSSGPLQEHHGKTEHFHPGYLVTDKKC